MNANYYLEVDVANASNRMIHGCTSSTMTVSKKKRVGKVLVLYLSNVFRLPFCVQIPPLFSRRLHHNVANCSSNILICIVLALFPCSCVCVCAVHVILDMLMVKGNDTLYTFSFRCMAMKRYNFRKACHLIDARIS